MCMVRLSSLEHWRFFTGTMPSQSRAWRWCKAADLPWLEISCHGNWKRKIRFAFSAGSRSSCQAGKCIRRLKNIASEFPYFFNIIKIADHKLGTPCIRVVVRRWTVSEVKASEFDSTLSDFFRAITWCIKSKSSKRGWFGNGEISTSAHAFNFSCTQSIRIFQTKTTHLSNILRLPAFQQQFTLNYCTPLNPNRRNQGYIKGETKHIVFEKLFQCCFEKTDCWQFAWFFL